MKNMRRLNILTAGMISATGLFVVLGTSVEAIEYQAKKAFDGALQPLVSPQSIGKGIKDGIGVISSAWKNGKSVAISVLSSAEAVLDEAIERLNDLCMFSEDTTRISDAGKLICKKRNIIMNLKERVNSIQEENQRLIYKKDLQEDDFISSVLGDISALGDQICYLFK